MSNSGGRKPNLDDRNRLLPVIEGGISEGD